MNTLKAEKRTMDTKAKRLRREGYVTGNVFGREMEGSHACQNGEIRSRETSQDKQQRKPDYAGCRWSVI